MTLDMNEHDLRVLRTLAGDGDHIGGWGAWVSVVIEGLHRRGLVTAPPDVRITDAGKQALSTTGGPDA